MRAEGCFMAFSIRMKKCRAAFAARRRVIPAGFEPTTDSLEGCCSIQLSYETMSIFGCKSTKFRSIYKFISCFLALYRREWGVGSAARRDNSAFAMKKNGCNVLKIV